MKILGIDPGYERLGIAVLEKEKGGKEILVHSECFQTKKTLPYSERLHEVGKRLETIIEQYRPSGIGIEKLFFTKNQLTGISVAGVCGVIQYIAASHSLEIREFAPQQIKIATTGDGRSDKQQIMSMIPKLIKLPKPIKYDDEYDAIAVGLTFFATNTYSK